MATLLEQVMFHDNRGIIFFENDKAAIVTVYHVSEWSTLTSEENEYDYYNVQEIYLSGEGDTVLPLRSFNFVIHKERVDKILKKIRGYEELDKIQWDEKKRHGILRYRAFVVHIHRVDTIGDVYDIESFTLESERIQNIYDLSEESLDELLSYWRQNDEELSV
jgi:hypothetical protein